MSVLYRYTSPPGDAGISLPFIASTTTLFTPALSPSGDAEIALPFIASTTTLFTPSLGGQSLEIPFIASTTTLFTPALSPSGDAEIALPFIASTTTLFSLSITPHISLPFIEARTEVFPFGLNAIALPFIGAKATLTTKHAGANNDLVFTARRGGEGGNAITVSYVRVGVSMPLTVEAGASQIVVYLATNASGNVTSTAAQVKAAIEAHPAANFLVTVALAPGNDGSGIPEPLPVTALSGGHGAVGAGLFTLSTIVPPWGPGPGPSTTPPGGGAAVSAAIYSLELCDRFGQQIANLTTLTYNKRGEYRKNRPTIWTGRVPSREAPVRGNHSDGRPKLCSGYRTLKVRRNGRLIFNGYILRVDRTGDAEEAWTTFIAIDPMHWWHFRLVRDETGNFSNPKYKSPIAGGTIVRRMLENSIGASSLHLSGVTEPPDGPLGLALGSFDETIPPAIDLGITLGTWPLTMSELSTTLTETGVLDIGIEPVEGGAHSPDTMGVVSARNRLGSDLSGSVHLDYGEGDHSISNVRYSDDMESITNKLWYLLGIRLQKTRWPANVTADDGDLPEPAQELIEAKIAQSRAALGVFMSLAYHDWGARPKTGPLDGDRELARLLWQQEADLRAEPRELLHVTPGPSAPFRPFDDYDRGDEIALNIAEEDFGIGIHGTQVVHGFDLMPDTNGVERVGELLTAAD